MTSLVMTRFAVVAVAVMTMTTMILLPPPMLPLVSLTPMASLVLVVVWWPRARARGDRHSCCV